METRALVAFFLSVAILLGYQLLFAPRPQEPVPSAGEQAQPEIARQEAAAQPAPAQTAPVVPSVAPAEERLVAIDSALLRIVLTSAGGRIKSLELKEHRETADPDSPLLDLVVGERLLPLGVYWTTADGRVASDARVDYAIDAARTQILGDDATTVTLVGAADDGVRVTKTLEIGGESYALDYRVVVTGAGTPAVGVAWSRTVAESSNSFAGVEGPVVYLGDTLESTSAADLEEPVVHQGPIAWAGYADHYFLSAYYPEQATALRFVAAAGNGIGEMVLWDDTASGEVAYGLFVGPKQLHLLSSLGHELDEAVDLGWFAFIARPMLELMIFLHRFTGHNYGWAIILMTVGIRVVFYPINKRQIESMKAMQRIQPELKRIQEKFKDDRERLNKEMMEVYRRHKVNPLSGCLPMLVQLPVFLGLYNALMQSIELRHAPFIGWISDLSQPDRLGTLAIPFVSPPGIPVMTLLMGASMVIQQRMTPATGDPVQQRMMMFLPVVFTIMFINFPAGLVLYWFSNNVLSILQQQLTTRAKS